jgi:hypothetical protein
VVGLLPSRSQPCQRSRQRSTGKNLHGVKFRYPLDELAQTNLHTNLHELAHTNLHGQFSAGRHVEGTRLLVFPRKRALTSTKVCAPDRIRTSGLLLRRLIRRRGTTNYRHKQWSQDRRFGNPLVTSKRLGPRRQCYLFGYRRRAHLPGHRRFAPQRTASERLVTGPRKFVAS